MLSLIVSNSPKNRVSRLNRKVGPHLLSCHAILVSVKGTMRGKYEKTFFLAADSKIKVLEISKAYNFSVAIFDIPLN